MADHAGGEDVAPSKKTQRYDRQLRLWGDHGQEALSSASICCIGANAVGTEILKNLVLPGIGAFTLVDPGEVTLSECGSNFFVSEDRIGEPLAKCATELLLEMNDYVKGDWLQEDCAEILRTRPDFFKSFSVVIAANQLGSTVDALSEVLWEANTPLLLARAYGNVGCIEIVVKEHCVVEYHGDTKHDMRLTEPFPALAKFMDSFPALEEMEAAKADGMPYAVVLYQHLQRWKAAHGGAGPSSYADKREFKEGLKAAQAKQSESIKEPPLNYVEAIDKCNPALTPSDGLKRVQPLLDRARAAPIARDAAPFWIMVDALRKFVDASGGALPLPGSIPDMHADSDVYIALQRVYRDKAAEDLAAVSGTVVDTLQSLGRPVDAISDGELKRFCQNAGKLFVLSTPERGAELRPEKAREFEAALAQHPNTETAWYLLLRAADRFHEAHGHFPGHFDEQVEEDIPKLKDCVGRTLDDLTINASVNDDCIHEMCRYGASVLHSVASFIGGVASQEVVKLVTRQYAPLDSVFVYNGVTSNCAQIQL